VLGRFFYALRPLLQSCGAPYAATVLAEFPMAMKSYSLASMFGAVTFVALGVAALNAYYETPLERAVGIAFFFCALPLWIFGTPAVTWQRDKAPSSLDRLRVFNFWLTFAAVAA